jgi:hypothetical protein
MASEVWSKEMQDYILMLASTADDIYERKFKKCDNQSRSPVLFQYPVPVTCYYLTDFQLSGELLNIWSYKSSKYKCHFCNQRVFC